jgi:hypothetical protein
LKDRERQTNIEPNLSIQQREWQVLCVRGRISKKKKTKKTSFAAVAIMGDHEEDKDEYKVPTKVGLNDLLERDKDDAALESYKKQLLGTNFYKRTCVSVLPLQIALFWLLHHSTFASWRECCWFHHDLLDSHLEITVARST